MKDSGSSQSLRLESEDEDANDSESYNYSNEIDDDDDDNDADFHQRNESILSTAWPQSYRQSIDLFGSVPSSFQGPLSLSRLGSSLLSSTLVREQTNERLPSLSRPLIHTPDEEERSPSHVQPPLDWKSSSGKSIFDKKESVVQEIPASRRSSFGQAVINGINVLCGVGILSTPYAVKEGGWLGISILIIYAVLSFYTGILLRRCLDSQPGLETYPDIGQAAFGTTGRIVVSIILYVELYACSIEYLILESDNLSSLFPNAHLKFGLLELNSHTLIALIVAIAILPTVWLKDMSILSYISAGGVMASILVVCCLFWVGLVDNVNGHASGEPLNISTLPVAIGLYGFCYSGHAVFPNIYSSMEKPSQYPAVLLTSFGFCTVLYAGVAVMGYLMFGHSTQSQFTLNMPQDLVASKIAVWTTVVNPFTKYALTLSPVAMSLEELIPSTNTKFSAYSILLRTALVISTLLVGLTVPYFGLVLALIGSLLTMLVTLVLPCVCYLRILKGKINLLQMVMCITVIAIGLTSSALGTHSAISKIVDKLSCCCC